jgi:1-acyl-sn-glycerol-3-phosphate acyltransferase
MRTLLVVFAFLLATPTLGAAVILAALLRVRDRKGSIYDLSQQIWARGVLAAAGARVVVHNASAVTPGQAHVVVANHVSWFDVFALGAVLPRYKFVAKAELEKIPIFGRAARAAGTIFIERENRYAAVEGLEAAASFVRNGINLVMCPEGTRGDEYALRPFKKGPFVLAIAAGVPVVPAVVYGAREVQSRRSFRVRSGEIHIHFLTPISTAGMTYADRDTLARSARDQMAALLRQEYNVNSPAQPRDPSQPQPGSLSPSPIV